MVDITRYGVIIQARTSSTRLPGKVLMDIEGQPMLLRQLRRLRHGLKVQKLVVATSDDPSDGPVEQLCRENSFQCFRGPLADVMLRFIQCARRHEIDYIVRVGGDDPLIDPECCNHLIELHRRDPHDFIFASNRDGWPFGCAAELIDREALERIHAKTSDPVYLEHTIPYFFDHPSGFRILRVKAPAEIQRPAYFFTVDYPEDLELIRAIFRRLRYDGDFFTLQTVIELIDREPGLRSINKHLHNGFER